MATSLIQQAKNLWREVSSAKGDDQLSIPGKVKRLRTLMRRIGLPLKDISVTTEKIKAAKKKYKKARQGKVEKQQQAMVEIVTNASTFDDLREAVSRLRTYCKRHRQNVKKLGVTDAFIADRYEIVARCHWQSATTENGNLEAYELALKAVKRASVSAREIGITTSVVEELFHKLTLHALIDLQKLLDRQLTYCKKHGKMCDGYANQVAQNILQELLPRIAKDEKRLCGSMKEIFLLAVQYQEIFLSRHFPDDQEERLLAYLDTLCLKIDPSLLFTAEQREVMSRRHKYVWARHHWDRIQQGDVYIDSSHNKLRIYQILEEIGLVPEDIWLTKEEIRAMVVETCKGKWKNIKREPYRPYGLDTVKELMHVCSITWAELETTEDEARQIVQRALHSVIQIRKEKPLWASGILRWEEDFRFLMATVHLTAADLHSSDEEITSLWSKGSHQRGSAA